jgi:hypothetical protein
MWHYKALVSKEKVSFFAVFGYFDTILYKINKKSRVTSCLGEYRSTAAGLSVSDGVQLMVDN